jgi:CheY-like chemotaxis protein
MHPDIGASPGNVPERVRCWRHRWSRVVFLTRTEGVGGQRDARQHTDRLALLVTVGSVVRVLVVDDEDDLRSAVCWALRAEGYTADAAADGAEGLAKARQVRPDLVLLDLRMPVLDGRAFLAARQLDPEPAAIPLGIMSSDHAAARAVQREFTIQAYLPKPFSTASLLAVVKAMRGPPRGLMAMVR